MSQLLDATMPTTHLWEAQVSRLLSYWIAFVLLYLPGWVIASLIIVSSFQIYLLSTLDFCGNKYCLIYSGGCLTALGSHEYLQRSLEEYLLTLDITGPRSFCFLECWHRGNLLHPVRSSTQFSIYLRRRLL
jgi:hypothetical protein